MRSIINLLFPPSCAVCGDSAPELVCDVLCERCNPQNYVPAILGSQELTDPERSCICCGEPTPRIFDAAPQCIACATWPSPLTTLRSVYRYEEQAAEIIKTYKYNHRFSLADYLALVMAETILRPGIFPTRAWDLILPIPSISSNLLKRGFSHTGLLARKISGLIGTPHSQFTLMLNRNHATQVNLSGENRFQNMQNAFRTTASKVAGRRILLIDDVVTTGSTLFSAALTLGAAGAKQVDALTYARSTQFSSLRLVTADQKQAFA
ncbi:ComF family protein [bacterium]|nr:ComF family protein [bacterium]